MWIILAEAVQQQNWKEGFYSYCNGQPVVMNVCIFTELRLPKNYHKQEQISAVLKT